jgi:hypothetical protein
MMLHLQKYCYKARDNGFKAAETYKYEITRNRCITVLNWLKEDKELQHIPVHVMSGMNREKLAKEMGLLIFN